MRPSVEISACAAAHDDEIAGPCLLPGWSRAHVITRLARNADTHVWLFEGALRGDVREQYPTTSMREADIESGATRDAKTLRDDLKLACGRLEEAWHAMNDYMWARTAIVTAGPRPMNELVFRRLREVEVHHVDLDLGYSPSHWPAAYVQGELTRRLPGLAQRADHVELVACCSGEAQPPA